MVMIYLSRHHLAAEQSFVEFSVDRWGKNWAIARKTPKNLSRYARCITRREYNEAKQLWADQRKAARELLKLPPD